jgi:hypothetical protein
MLRSSRTGPTKIGSLTRASTVIVGALVALFGVIAGPLLGVFVTSASAATASSYTAITPYRALGTAAAGASVVAGTPAAVQITSTTAGEVPAGATAAVLNVTASAPTSAGYLEVYPTGAAPTNPTSNVNFVAGETVANLVTVPLSATGGISVANFAGTTAVDVDVEGYYSASGTGLYNPLSPVRVAGTAASGVPVAANTAVPVTVDGGTTGVPTNATAVVVNLTAAGGTSASYLSAYAAGATPATTSSLNFTAGETVANRDVVNVGTGGQIEVYNFAGSVNVDVDVDGYYGPTGAVFTPLAAPIRVADTRAATVVGTQTAIASGGTETFNLSTTASTIPATATAVAANFTVVPGTAPGYITVFPTGVTTNPTASDVNWPASSGPVANFTQADTAGTTGGSVQVYNLNSGSPIDLVVDAFGYFTGGTTAASVAPVAVPVTNPTTTVVTGTPLPANGITTEAINTTVYHGTAIAANEVTGDTVQFVVTDGTAASCGTVSPTSAVTNGSGLATTTYKAPTYSASPLTTGTCIITATDSIYQETGSTSIGQTVPPSTLAVSGGTNLPANASSQDTLSVTVTPFPGVSAASDVVTFGLGAHCGTLATPTATTPATGAAVATDVYTAPAVSGICQIAVSDALGGTAALNIDATTSPTPSAGTLTVTAPTSNPDSVAVGSAAVSVTVVAKDSTSTPIVGDEVLFTPTGDCTGVASYQATAAGGTVTYSYTPEATTVGTCTIAAQESDTGASTSVAINQTAIATSIALTGGATLAPGTSETLTVTPSSPPASDAGAAITFTVTGSAGCGTVPATTGAGTTPYGGTSTYTAGVASGFCNVTATEGGVTSNTLQIDQT